MGATTSPRRSHTRITKRRIERLTPDEQIWDADLCGFGARKRVDGVYYIVRYRLNGRRRWLTVGQHGPLSPDQARKEAARLLGDVARGGDPVAAKERAKSAGTVSELAARYLNDYARPRKKPSSIAEDERLLRLHILPTFGPLRVNDVTQNDVQRWHDKPRAKPSKATGRSAIVSAVPGATFVAANRALALLKHMFNLARKWGLRTSANPADGISRFPEKGRERIVTAAEMARLGAALAKAENDHSEHPSVIACVRLLALTGARLSEIQKLRWEYVDLEGGAIRLPDSKTGPKTIPLGGPAIRLLDRLPRVAGEPHVCYERRAGSWIADVQHPWRRIRRAAGLSDLRLHDLRHGFASVAAMGGDSLYLIGKALGHRQASTTEKYAHLQNDPVRAVADKASRRIEEAMVNGPTPLAALQKPRA